MQDSDPIFTWKPEKADLLALMSKPPSYYFREELFPKGIDNAHTDVLLSSQFVLVAQNLVQSLLHHDVEQSLFGAVPEVPNIADIEAFNDAYIGLMETALGMTRERSRPELLQLLQLSVLKFTLMTINEEFNQYKESMNEPRGAQTSSKAVQQHDRFIALSREEPFIRFRLCQKMLGLVQKIEDNRLRKRRKSILGRSWPIPKQALFNPLLTIDNISSKEQMISHYSLALLPNEKTDFFAQVNRIVCKQLFEFLPSWVRPARRDKKQIQGEFTLRRDQGSLSGFLELELLLGSSLRPIEFSSGEYSWLDVPSNMEKLLRLPEAVTNLTQWQQFQQILLNQFYRHFDEAHLLNHIMIMQEVKQLYDQHSLHLSLRQITNFMYGKINRRELLRKLTGHCKESVGLEIMRDLEQVDTHIKNLTDDEKKQSLINFLVQFCVFRRDLKLAFHTHWLMNKLRLLTTQKEIELSRSNRSLHEFLLIDEISNGTQQIRNHVIVKADVRGSTRITAELMGRKLNPASYFSLNFFDPITELLEAFGAKKVFVEGDAVILSLYEYEDAAHDWLSVARACGLAKRILAVVDAHNVQNRKYNLPSLELGLGIAFRDEPPAFLYDGDQQIMISSAINRADRLSSCSSELRQTGLGQNLKRGIEVVVPVDQSLLKKESEDQLQRFNVDGIELEPEAFAKLRTELALQKLAVPLAHYSEYSVFYLGRFPDKHGKLLPLVVRESPVRLWIGNDLSTEEKWGRRFYEVITDESFIDELKQLAQSYFSKRP